MVESSGSKIAGATRYIHDVCDEVVAVARCLQERFAKGKVLPEEYSSGECYTWPTQSPGAKFFETFGCWIKVYTKKPRKYWGCAAYLFDLGGRNTYATKKDEALVLAAWTGKSSNTDDDLYDIDHLHTVLSSHVAFEPPLLCWIEEDGKPRYNAEDQSWCYAVPLLSIRTEDDAERLLIRPLIELAIAPQLTTALVERAFAKAPEVMS